MHCVGMCGPISMAVGGKARHPWMAGMIYNVGRTLTYSLIGAFIGLVGKGIFIAGLQKFMSVGLGIMLLLIAIFSINVKAKLLKIKVFSSWFVWLKSTTGGFVAWRSATAPLMVGLVNGLLPCGLVYMAMLGALSSNSLSGGMLYMASFGRGTLPMMMALSLAGGLSSWHLRSFFQKLYPVLLALSAFLFFLYRGLNFHLPGTFFFQEKMKDLPMYH
jgi:sulfite exporter TauE/SafE